MNYTVEIDRSVSALCYCLERLNNEVDNKIEFVKSDVFSAIKDTEKQFDVIAMGELLIDFTMNGESEQGL